MFRVAEKNSNQIPSTPTSSTVGVNQFSQLDPQTSNTYRKQKKLSEEIDPEIQCQSCQCCEDRKEETRKKCAAMLAHTQARCAAMLKKFNDTCSELLRKVSSTNFAMFELAEFQKNIPKKK